MDDEVANAEGAYIVVHLRSERDAPLRRLGRGDVVDGQVRSSHCAATDTSAKNGTAGF